MVASAEEGSGKHKRPGWTEIGRPEAVRAWVMRVMRDMSVTFVVGGGGVSGCVSAVERWWKDDERVMEG